MHLRDFLRNRAPSQVVIVDQLGNPAQPYQVVTRALPSTLGSQGATGLALTQNVQIVPARPTANVRRLSFRNNGTGTIFMGVGAQMGANGTPLAPGERWDMEHRMAVWAYTTVAANIGWLELLD